MEAVLSVMRFERMRGKEGCMLRRQSIFCLSPFHLLCSSDGRGQDLTIGGQLQVENSEMPGKTWKSL